MADSKKTSTMIGALAIAVASGAAGERIANPPHKVNASFYQLRVLTDRQGAPPRYAITITTQVGAAQGAREIVCNHDGSSPKLNGVPISDVAATELCAQASKFGISAQQQADALADRLSR